MKCILMNKNKKVLFANYDPETGVFTEIYDVFNIDCAEFMDVSLSKK